MKTSRSICVAALGLCLGVGAIGLRPAPLAAAETPLRFPRPVWLPGFSWTYLRTPEKTPDQKRTVEYRVVHRIRLEDGDYYVLQREGKEFFYSLDLGYRMTRGTRVERENRPAFPAFRGLWKGQRNWEQRLDILVADQPPRVGGGAFRVVGRERVMVPAGRFEAVHLTYMEGGKLNREYWYSPKVKWVVREKVYWREGGWTDELESFHVTSR
ncbi:MAG TPA: hypothetical protein VIG69_13905 [Candidatus Methylomirabilis sp.]